MIRKHLQALVILAAAAAALSSAAASTGAGGGAEGAWGLLERAAGALGGCEAVEKPPPYEARVTLEIDRSGDGHLVMECREWSQGSRIRKEMRVAKPEAWPGQTAYTVLWDGTRAWSDEKDELRPFGGMREVPTSRGGAEPLARMAVPPPGLLCPALKARDRFEPVLLGEEPVEGRPCFRVRLGRKGSGSGPEAEYWIDRERLLPLRRVLGSTVTDMGEWGRVGSMMLPMRVVTTSWPTEDELAAGADIERLETRVLSITLHESLPDDLFRPPAAR